MKGHSRSILYYNARQYLAYPYSETLQDFHLHKANGRWKIDCLVEPFGKIFVVLATGSPQATQAS
jgi:hypothetical protein